MNYKISLLAINNLDDRNGSLKYINAKVNKKYINFLIDSGATRSCINENDISFFIGKNEEPCFTDGEDIIGLGTKKHKSKECVLKKITMGRFHKTNFYVNITDLSHIFSMLKAAANVEIHGIIGNDFLSEHNAVINYEKNFIRLSSVY